jgi:cytosine/adenosine deaminase-related metal-dependent hydrolase
VCFTPLSEMRVGYGLAPVMAMHEAKIPLSLGIDTLVLAGNADPFKVMQTTLNLATGMSENEQALTAHDVLYWATQGGANAMGLGAQTGSISVGKRADLLLIDARHLALSPLTDAAACVVQSCSPSDVDSVIADGRLLKQGGQLLGVNRQALAREVDRAWQQLRV